MECSHLLDNVKADGVLVTADSTITKNFSCSECGTKEQNWLCLQCGAVHCGRYVNGHAKLHAEQVGHQLCISCDVFSVYCYKCDDYVSNDTENQAIDKVRQSIMSVSKIEKENNIEQNDNSKDGSESNLESNEQPASPSNNGTDAPDETPTSSCAEVPVTTSTMDITGSKPSKSAKTPEEPARSLRPRSRKRSHSEDSSSTENSNSSLQPVKKKTSPCNGKTQREKKIVGLKNLGNTCFMNAVLQSLNNIQEFSCYFSQLPSLEVKTNGRKVYHSRSYTRQEVNEVVMAEELRKVLINLNSGCGGKGAISPEYLFHVIWKVVPRFRGYQQQDAHEFLRYMLDRLHTELLQLVPLEREAGALPRARSASIVTAVFGGTLQSEVRCLACGTESKKFDPFLDLSLELPDAGRHDEPVPLTDCLESFVQIEELADTERYFCSSCKCKQKSTKQFWIRRLPNVLCLHLKRFRWHNNYRNKVDTSISFPLTALDMSGFVPHNVPDTRRSGLGNYLYDLAAVIVHHGSGAASGHYTAYAINEEQWFHFNDQTVRATHAEAVASCKPYILFYIRRELALPAAS
ncbi:ubiquitin carboxyl-terminal hydrolase 3-like isoform X2 [Pectinophora gossypiella]|uniref:ubiquitin carboxyl-terminal hydrolase 3-like isoform X2 n=1 Tax=Pectinophora gossypiella TaxID=13191 RepID=UPI00214ECCD0|nr:ubiquitin carboxyl-terminal hydrolase 3-like isoform X2 [Pectinophora gossypiella]